MDSNVHVARNMRTDRRGAGRISVAAVFDNNYNIAAAGTRNSLAIETDDAVVSRTSDRIHAPSSNVVDEAHVAAFSIRSAP